MLRLKHLLSDPRGASAIEFALVAPMLAFMVVGITDAARAVGRKFQLDQAVYRTLEMVTVGALQSDYSYVIPEAALASGEAASNIDVRTWLECDGVKQANSAAATCPGTQEVARFVKVTIKSDFKPLFSYGPFGAGNNKGVLHLASRSTLRVK
ncbi:MAG: pilus assembly protein [Sphingosinicella sp.]|nr:pilus assembly protein [Sphingosinicella sp.]